jgi:hypothetical protein
MRGKHVKIELGGIAGSELEKLIYKDRKTRRYAGKAGGNNS